MRELMAAEEDVEGEPADPDDDKVLRDVRPIQG